MPRQSRFPPLSCPCTHVNPDIPKYGASISRIWSILISVWALCAVGLYITISSRDWMGMIVWTFLLVGASCNQGFLLGKYYFIFRVMDIFGCIFLMVWLLIRYWSIVLIWHNIIIMVISVILVIWQCYSNSLHDFRIRVNIWHGWALIMICVFEFQLNF